MSSSAGNPANFANRSQAEVENIAKKGGQSSHSGGFASMDPGKQVCLHALRFMSHYRRDNNADHLYGQHDIASKGGQYSGGSFEPGSDRAREAGHRGGQASGSSAGGFASMDPGKQVRCYFLAQSNNKTSKTNMTCADMFSHQHGIASKGGQQSGGSFEAGSQRAREAGHKGGMASGGSFETGSERAKEAGHIGGSAHSATT